MLKTVDLFCGGGGLSLGFERAGFYIAAAFEKWRPACHVYAANFPQHHLIEMDLSQRFQSIEAIKTFSPDIIIGGPPCQDFSSAGKRDETLGRADLTIDFAHIVGNIRPAFFVMENVARAIKSVRFQNAIEIFKEAGYGLTIQVLNAALCGVPQSRKRAVVIGSLYDADNFLDKKLIAGLAPKEMTLRDYFGNSLGIEHYYRHPRSYARRGIFSIDEPSPTIRGVNRPLPQGYLGHPGDSAMLDENIRPLTTHERSMIQTFPIDFQWPGKKTDIEQIIGNAVPVILAEYVAKTLKEHIADLKGQNKSLF